MAEAWSNAGNLRRAQSVLDDMEQRGPKPSVRTYKMMAAGMQRNQTRTNQHELINRSKDKAHELLSVHRDRSLLDAMTAAIGADIQSNEASARLEFAFKQAAGHHGVTDTAGALHALHLLGVPSSDLLKRYLHDADDNGDGSLDYGEFVHAVKFVFRRLAENLQEARNGGISRGKQAREATARQAGQSLTARAAARGAGWVPAFFWRFDSIRNAFSSSD